MTPDVFALYDVIDDTWPAAKTVRAGQWTIREGRGGGSRVSAATHDQTKTYDIEQALVAMRQIDQTPIFMIRHGQGELDTALEAKGFVVKDPVNLYLAPVSKIATKRPPPVTSFEVYPPLAAQREIWADGGVGPERLAIMDRVKGPKTTILGRISDTPAGTGFVAMSGKIAMLHALETHKPFRRQGLGRYMLNAMGFWALEHGADYFALLVTQANVGANALYSSLGMEIIGKYHYRVPANT